VTWLWLGCGMSHGSREAGQFQFFLGLIDTRNLVHQAADLPVHRVNGFDALGGAGGAGAVGGNSYFAGASKVA
jgi:hypothetical protein